MPEKYICNVCNYETPVHCNYNKHLITGKHIKLKKIEDDKKMIKDDEKMKQNVDKITCEHCNKLVRKSNISRHYKICKKNTMEIAKYTESEMLKIQTEMLKCMQTMSTNRPVTNIHNGPSNSCNIYYVVNNCTNALNYDEIMSAPLTEAEILDLENNSAVVGSINLLTSRCIDNIEFHKRPFHLVDGSRKKYCVKIENEWCVDMKGDTIMDKLYELLKTLYLSVNENDTTESILLKTKKYKELYDNKDKILGYINEKILLQNNTSSMICN
jgi:hypothetical protein